MRTRRQTSSDTVLHAISSGGMYGIERMLLNLLPELARQGCPASLLCLDGPGTEVGRAAEAIGIPTIFVDAAGRVSPRAWFQLFRSIGTMRPRLVHVHGYKASILAGAAALAHRIPVVATYHSVAAEAGQRSRALSRYHAVENFVLRRADGVAAVSEQIAAELQARGVARERIRVIPNGIASPGLGKSTGSKPTTTEEFRPCILSLSRLVPEKNLHVVIAAIAELKVEFPQIGLILAGDGPLLEQLKRQATDLHLEDSVTFVGFVPNVQPLLSRADVFVLASQTEGMPISVLEAMAQGTPIVASNVGGIPLMAEAEHEALLVEPNDQRRLTEGLRRLIVDEGLRAKLARGARVRFERDYSAARMALGYTRLYEEMEPHARPAVRGFSRSKRPPLGPPDRTRS